jgi:predicted nucleotidyltransferase
MDSTMMTTRKQALEIAAQARRGLETLYGDRLRGVYLYGSGARDQLTPDSDIDIAVILDALPNRFAEHERTSQLGADLSLEYGIVVVFFFTEEAEFQAGRFGIHRAIKQEGIAA